MYREIKCNKESWMTVDVIELLCYYNSGKKTRGGWFEMSGKLYFGGATPLHFRFPDGSASVICDGVVYASWDLWEKVNISIFF